MRKINISILLGLLLILTSFNSLNPSQYRLKTVVIDAGHGEGFCIGNIMKYAQRYGRKAGKNRVDLMKIIHLVDQHQVFLLMKTKLKLELLHQKILSVQLLPILFQEMIQI